MKERKVSIDILKCLAAILITNSHMQMLYPKFSFLATGGAVGDVLSAVLCCITSESISLVLT